MTTFLDRGPRGPAGGAGVEGPQGPTGATGATGPQGDPGLDGATGATGPEGPQGDPGEAGDTGPAGVAPLVFGASGGPSAIDTDRYLVPGGGNAAISSAELGVPMPVACTITAMYVRATGAGSGTSSTVFTLRKNGVDTALVVTIPLGNTTGNVSGSISLAAGDSVSIKVRTSGGSQLSAHANPYAGLGLS
jgi:hypothetical protein